MTAVLRTWLVACANLIAAAGVAGCATDDEPADPNTGWPADLQVDWQDYSCKGEEIALPDCASPTAVVSNVPFSLPASHIPLTSKIT